MKVENALYTSPQRIASFAATSSSGPDGRSETITGQEAYMRYGAEMRKIVERAGGKPRRQFT